MNRWSSQGTTLVELLITLAVAAILLTLAGPAFLDLIRNNRRAAQINEMVASLSLARAEAVKSGAGAVVCITDGASPPDCDSTATQWENGWLVIVDRDKDGTVTTADGDLILEAHEALPSGFTFRGNANVSWRVPFSSRGTSANGTLTMCDSRGVGNARGIIISNTGRARLTSDTDGDGTEDDGAATPNELTCP